MEVVTTRKYVLTVCWVVLLLMLQASTCPTMYSNLEKLNPPVQRKRRNPMARSALQQMYDFDRSGLARADSVQDSDSVPAKRQQTSVTAAG